MQILLICTSLFFFLTTLCYAAKLVSALDECNELRQKIKELQK